MSTFVLQDTKGTHDEHSRYAPPTEETVIGQDNSQESEKNTSQECNAKHMALGVLMKRPGTPTVFQNKGWN